MVGITDENNETTNESSAPDDEDDDVRITAKDDGNTVAPFLTQRFEEWNVEDDADGNAEENSKGSFCHSTIN